MKKSLPYLIAFLTLVFIGFTGVRAAASAPGLTNIFYAVGTSTAETVPTAGSVVILATSTGRTWAKFSNNSANPIFCAYGVPAANNQGFLVPASTTYEMNQLNAPVYTGPVSCIAQGAAASVWVQANPR